MASIDVPWDDEPSKSDTPVPSNDSPQKRPDDHTKVPPEQPPISLRYVIRFKRHSFVATTSNGRISKVSDERAKDYIGEPLSNLIEGLRLTFGTVKIIQI